MSDELLLNRGRQRLLNSDEKELVLALLEKADHVELDIDWINQVQVVPMDDGGMGSLRFLSSSLFPKMGKNVAEICFVDDSGVDVVASLNVDEEGRPFELDIWKTNFEPLVGICRALST